MFVRTSSSSAIALEQLSGTFPAKPKCCLYSSCCLWIEPSAKSLLSDTAGTLLYCFMHTVLEIWNLFEVYGPLLVQETEVLEFSLHMHGCSSGTDIDSEAAVRY